MDINKIHMHFILPGGGVNGAFQAGFLYRLFKDYQDKIIIDRIDGVSVGALNGFAIILEDIEFIKSIWYYIEDRNTIFNSHMTNSEMWYKGSIYDSIGLRNIIYMHKDFIKNEELYKYNCVIHNCTTNSYEYINGKQPDLLDYIIASASPPIISPYLKINHTYYADGCIDQIYPIDFLLKENGNEIINKNIEQIDVKINNSDNKESIENIDKINNSENTANKMNIVVGYYENTNYYLFNIYKTFKRNIYNNNLDIEKLKTNNNIITINNPCFYNLIDFTRENIENGFKLGEEEAKKFSDKYILKINQI